jgi:hypothetical protein
MENIEFWKDIVGYEGRYKVSNNGNVKSLARITESRKGVFQNKKEVMLKSFDSGRGYLKYKLCSSGEKTISAHKLVAMAFIENPENKSQINHLNGLKKDNRVCNLEWCTGSENVIHSLNNNLKISQKGSEHGMSKLTEKNVLEIRKIGRTKTLKEIGKIYNVDASLISLVLLNKIWKHI